MSIIEFLVKNRFWFFLLCLILIIGFIFFICKPTTFEPYSKDKSSYTETLKSLPYVTWAPIEEEDIKKSGVTRYNKDLAYRGVNIYSSENKPGGYLLDMSGRILHKFQDNTKKKIPWKLFKPYFQYHFLVLKKGKVSIFKIDWHSDVKWEKRIRAHHDFAIAPNGDIYALTSKKVLLPDYHTKRKILNDYLTILRSDTNIKKEISFATMILKKKNLAKIIKEKKKIKFKNLEVAWDLFHTNTVEIINRDIFKRKFLFFKKRLFKKGDILFCMRHMNIIGIVDVNKEEIIWSWGENDLEFPHHPSLLDNGNILIFDNGVERKYSRVIELNPLNEKIEWEYKANPPDSFYSRSRGSAQRLPNGNTLITVSSSGYVFEITEAGEVVWEFYNPEIKEDGKNRATIYRMLRITDIEKHPYLRSTK